MPITGYRSIEERLFAFPLSPSRRLPPLFKPEVYRYRSMEEANEAQEAALIERARAARRGKDT